MFYDETWGSLQSKSELTFWHFENVETEPETLGDRPKPMTIAVGCRCHQVTDADFAVGDWQYIGYHTDANDVTR
jgi:hypothetical protein